MTTSLTDRSKQALSLAFDLHKDQKRKIAPGESEDLAVPYIAHLMNVASYVLQAGGNEDQFIAALLHDSIEDQPNTLGKPTAEIIKEQFGERVLELVLTCTDGEPNQVRDASTWRYRKEKHLQHLKSSATKDPEALLVPLADKLDNCESLVRDLKLHGPVVWKRFNSEPNELVWYYQSVLEIFKSVHSRDDLLIMNLQSVFTEIRSFNAVLETD
jgi:(p)ppGpp synthase/HD superfamily hydrolase